ncbi:hypothetical protein [Bradyrhizobium sp. RP6]|uniref:hypothetical protein n=1 Tax=Bradyrhizobium sp. RP6 TaxID=2489596 RepID=UPI001FDEC2D8|nr:hypothetical protein [Bradyrhizobium sp. RP6]
MKTQIIEELGQGSILLPALVAEGLAANDRIKVRMSALQAAAGMRRSLTGPRMTSGSKARLQASLPPGSQR